MTRRSKEWRAERLELIRLYIEDGHPSPYTMHDVATWAIREGLWSEDPINVVRRLAGELADAAGIEKFRDETTGLWARRYHSARVVQENGGGEEEPRHLWDDFFTMSHEFFVVSVNDRVRQIRGDIAALEHDVSVYDRTRLPPGYPPTQGLLRFGPDDGEGMAQAGGA